MESCCLFNEQKKNKWSDITIGEDLKLINNSKWLTEAQKNRRNNRNVKLGLVRSLIIIVDLSERGLEQSFFGLPKAQIIKEQLYKFIGDYFDQNPISQLSIAVTHDSKCEFLSNFSSNPKDHEEAVNKFSNINHTGEPSLQISLDNSIYMHKGSSEFSTKEVLLIYSSFTSCDSDPLDKIIEDINKSNIVVSIIGFGAEVYALKKIYQNTFGEYNIPTSTEHLIEIFKTYIYPPEFFRKNQNGCLIPFGFCSAASTDTLSFDIFDLKNNFKNSEPKNNGYNCPKCGIRVYNLPVFCPVCQIFLIGPADLTRTLHHLQPLNEFELIFKSNICKGCNIEINSRSFKCKKCNSFYCEKCNDYIHEYLQQCPGCLY